MHLPQHDRPARARTARLAALIGLGLLSMAVVAGAPGLSDRDIGTSSSALTAQNPSLTPPLAVAGYTWS